MKRIIVILGVIVALAGLSFLGYQGNQRLQNAENRVAELTRQVNEATKAIQQESAAIHAASQSANEAAIRADLAAKGRQAAEEQKQQAESGRAQAETAAQKAAEQASDAHKQMAEMRKEREEELNRMQGALNRVVETRRTSSGMVMVLPDSVFRFAFDSAELSPKNRELLSRISGILLISKGYGLSVFGYTDDVGTQEYNEQLSIRRANAVRNYLVQAGIDSATINATGYGKTSPLIASKTPDARAQNRRVEIALTDSSIRYTGEAPDVSR